MSKSNLSVYVPRNDNEIYEELKTKLLPIELKEQLQIVDSYPELIEKKIKSIIQRIFEKNSLTNTLCMPQLQLSGSDNENASIITTGKQPVLIITKGLLKNVQSEDELAGVIAHELGHLLLYKQHQETEHHNKIEETAADNLGVKLLHQAGYDPDGIIYFLRRAGGDKAHLITIEDITHADSLDEGAHLIQTVTDPHPSDKSRIRAMETNITSLKRDGILTNIPKITLLDKKFKKAVNNVSYTSPIAKGLNDIGYENLSILQKLGALTTLLNDIYPPTNSTSAERLAEIAGYIDQLTVDFAQPDQSEAFKCLADVTMGHKIFDSKSKIVSPKEISPGSYIDRKIIDALEHVWIRGGKDSQCLARREDLKKSLEQFYDAKTKEEAEHFASEIVALCKKINIYRVPSKFKGFYSPSIQEVKTAIEVHGSWNPPYQKQVLWCLEEHSENIKKVLSGMNLDKDPWAKNILGFIENNEKYQLHWIIHNPDLATTLFEEVTLWAQFVRTKEGVATELLTVYPYPWKHFAPETTLEMLTLYHQRESENKRLYEDQVVSNVDWELLKTDFSRFILQYGRLIFNYYSVVPVASPFARKFFDELTTFLPHADEDYIAQISGFFENNTTRDRAAIPHFIDFYPKDNQWSYLSVSKPKYWYLNHPFIQFILNPISSTMMTDYFKLRHLKETSGFIIPDSNKKLKDIFSISLRSILSHYPQSIKTVDDLDAASKVKPAYETITLALEAERLAYEFETSMTLQEFVILDNLSRLDRNEEEYVSNMNTFFTQLKHKTVQRALNIGDCEELIKNYRFAVAHYLLQEIPSMRHEAHEKIKTILPKLPAPKQLECLKALFKPEVIKPREIGTLELDKKYDGYIVNPEFRSWAIEQLTDLIVADLGKDDGSTDYLTLIKLVIDDIGANTVGITQLTILSTLATKINAQKEVAFLMRDTYNHNSVASALAKSYEGVAIELLINESNKDPVLRQHLLDFLAKPLNQSSTSTLRDYIKSKYGYKFLKFSEEVIDDVIDDQLQNYYKNFRASSLTMRIIYLEPLLFPLRSTENEQLDIIQKLIDEVFPTSANTSVLQQNTADENEYAKIIINAYLGVAQLAERRLLTTALFVATMQEEQDTKRTLGQKLNMVLSHMGPAGGKLLQAIHSHPQTPEDLKRDIASSKTLFDPPLRWELVEYVDKNGLLEHSENNPNPVINIGSLVGAGSFGLTVFNTLSDGTKVADTFLRDHAAIKAERELTIMSAATNKIVALKPELKPITNMVNEAQRSAREETNMQLAEQANALAVQSYHNIRVVVGTNQFTHEVTQLQKIGDNFKRVTIAPGEHFNDLKTSPYKTALAKAMVVTQLSLRLAGFNTDLDRHGGNIKIQGNTITHFDFGAMNLSSITEEDKRITGKILAQILIAVFKGDAFSDALLTTIQNAQVSEVSRIYLNGLNKDFLALGDYFKEIDKQELAHLVAQCLIGDTVDSQINTAFKEELGLAPYVLFYFSEMLNILISKIQGNGSDILLNEALNNGEQVQYKPKNKMCSPLRYHGAFFSHKTSDEVLSLSIEQTTDYSID
ncbi:heat shock protein HtpX [Legionella sainthelensi]|uniref:Heat shock protein HtpX n=1 Tax=Legionella sainthelensi TaxID=28087 RepID=A0A0W0YE93_9GAMM|nr:M48 family metallopeptidase [Legionella sainthelensi]KTD55265.1 heat shock protein HtpX [Legionella sainthelensi]VEH37307.1 Putative Zn-dependent protease [Legionella sainthelensi]